MNKLILMANGKYIPEIRFANKRLLVFISLVLTFAISHAEGSNKTEYKFDGKELRDSRGNKIAVLDGKYIRDNRGNKIGVIDGKYFRDSRGNKVAEFDGKDIRDSRGLKIAAISDVKKVIDGIGGASLVAMWLFFVR